MFQSGSLRCKARGVYLNCGGDESIEIPVPWFLVLHPKGHVVIDGGLPAICARDPQSHWGAVLEEVTPIFTDGEDCVSQLERIGISNRDIRYVLLSHLHIDHVGAIGRFPNATHIVQRREMSYAFMPDWFAASSYQRRDFDRPELPWYLIDDAAPDTFDLYGDGSILAIRTPGHTPGHQSFLITTSKTGSILLGVDAVDTMEHWAERALPGYVCSSTDAARSVRMLRMLVAQRDAVVVPGHDPIEWQHYRKAPEFY